MYIDFHTHAFADKIVEKAMRRLEATSGIKPYTDGTLTGLKQKLKQRGIEKAVILPIATKPSQQTIVNDWAREVCDDETIYSFGSVHPDAEDVMEELERIKELGLYGIKFHPDYQDFFADEEKMIPVYQKCAQLGLPVIFHAGYDPLSPNLVHGMPDAFLRIYEQVPQMTMILAHLGGMKLWDMVEELLAGKTGRLYFDVGVIAPQVDPAQLERIVNKHGADRILFGSDCPWDDPEHEINMIKNLNISDVEKDLIFYKNAQRILNIR